MNSRKLVVGLGNPGRQYQNTPHNLGFEVLDHLASEMRTSWVSGSCAALVAEGSIANASVVLLKPQTYMNDSGRSVRLALEVFSSSVEDLLVVSDDLALPWGKIRIRPSGGAGGHNGLKSIIESLGSGEFGRIRLGILPETPITDAAEYVLSPIPREAGELVAEMVERGREAVKLVTQSGLLAAMNRFN